MIYVDDRIGSVEIAPYIAAPKEVTRLDAGDFMFMGNGPNGNYVSVGVERKRVKDLLNSISTGRLSGHQLIQMSQSFNYCYLLVEGQLKMNSETGVLEYRKNKPIKLGSRTFTYREVTKFLNTLAVMCGIRIWRTRNMRETGAWLTYMFNWWSKDWDKHSAHQQYQEETFYLVKPPFINRVMRELAGVREVRGDELAKVFNSMDKLMGASVEDFQEVKGVGKKTAESIWKELHNG